MAEAIHPLERLAALFDRQTLDKEEQAFVRAAVHTPLARHEAFAEANLEVEKTPKFAAPSRTGVNQYTFKIWVLPRGQKDYPWKVPRRFVDREGWKRHQHGCYAELVGKTGKGDHELNERFFWGFKVSGSEWGMKELQAALESAGVLESSGLLDLKNRKKKSPADFVNGQKPAIGISTTWYLLGFEVRREQLLEYRSLQDPWNDLLDDIARGLVAAYRAFDAFASQFAR